MRNKISLKPHHVLPKLLNVFIETLLTPLFIFFCLVGNAATAISAYVFFLFERGDNPNVHSLWDALWWALCTVSTVGYGDIVPLTVGGRLVGIFLIITGVMCFLGSMAVLASVLTNFISFDQKWTVKNIKLK